MLQRQIPSRLCRRHRALTQIGKRSVVVNTAVAREMAAFMWVIAREVQLNIT
jgi:transposase